MLLVAFHLLAFTLPLSPQRHFLTNSTSSSLVFSFCTRPLSTLYRTVHHEVGVNVAIPVGVVYYGAGL
jgi:hypothetical protein